MKVRYTHGGLHPADLDKRRIMSSLNESNPSTDDPVLRRMRDQQLASDRAGMLEGRVQVGDDYVDMPYPTSFTGQVTPDRSYLLDLAGLGSLGKSAIQKLMRSAGSKGSSKASIDAARREMLEGFSERTGDKALQQMRDRQATSRVQNVADRAIRQGAQEESQAALNFQGKAQKILDDLNFSEYADQAEYNNVLKDVENLYRTYPEGSPEFIEQFSKSLGDKLSKYGISPESAKKALSQKPVMLNEFGGTIKTIRR
tara:strand:+ start:5895 stop:6662 length:768 start_codon:yes stop_codon:yes gene_type:complete